MAWGVLGTAHMDIHLADTLNRDTLHPLVHTHLRDIRLMAATLLKAVTHPRAILHRDTHQRAMLHKGIHLEAILQQVTLHPYPQLMDMVWAVIWGHY